MLFRHSSNLTRRNGPQWRTDSFTLCALSAILVRSECDTSAIISTGIQNYPRNITTVRLKYDDTHSDQEFSECELDSRTVWAFRRRFHAFLENSWSE